MATVTIPNPTDVTPAASPPAQTPWWHAPGRQWRAFRDQREDQVFLVLTLLIGALVGLVVVAFILITERSGALVSRRRFRVAKSSCSRRRLAGYGISPLSILSRCTRQRRATNES